MTKRPRKKKLRDQKITNLKGGGLKHQLTFSFNSIVNQTWQYLIRITPPFQFFFILITIIYGWQRCGGRAGPGIALPSPFLLSKPSSSTFPSPHKQEWGRGQRFSVGEAFLIPTPFSVYYNYVFEDITT